MGKGSKPKKMSMSEFMAGTKSEVDMLPTGPKQRGPDENGGSFRRGNQGRNNMRENRDGGRRSYGNDGGEGEEGPQSWRGRGNMNDRHSDGGDRHERHSNQSRGRDNEDSTPSSWRGSGNRSELQNDSYDDSRRENRGRDYRSREGSGGYSSRADEDTSWRSTRHLPPSRPAVPNRAHSERFGRSDYSNGPRAERPKLQLSKRTIPKEEDSNIQRSSQKSSIFGAAKAVDTSSRLASQDMKEKGGQEEDAAATSEGPPLPLNSRAAALSISDAPSSKASSRFADARRNMDGGEDDRRGSGRRGGGYSDDRRGGRSYQEDDRRRFSRHDDEYDGDRRRDEQRQFDSRYNSRSDRSFDRRSFGDDRKPSYQDDYRRGSYRESRRSSDDRNSQERNFSDRRVSRGSLNDQRRPSEEKNYHNHQSYDQGSYYNRNNGEEQHLNDIPKNSVQEEFPPLGAVPEATRNADTEQAPQSNQHKLLHQEKQEEIVALKGKKEYQGKKEIEPKAQLEAAEVQKQKQEEIVSTFCALEDSKVQSFYDEHKDSLSDVKSITYSLFKHHNHDTWVNQSFATIIKSIAPATQSQQQCQILWAIQKYCLEQSFPKDNGKPIIQKYFETMFNKGLVEYEVFFEWKDDESKEHEEGKTKAIIQTMEWFQCLEDMLAEDDEEYDDYEDDEGYDGY